MKKKIILGLSVLVIASFFLYKYIYKEHRDIASEKEAFTLGVTELKQEFQTNDSLANAKYLDQTIVIKGKITSIDTQNNTLMIDASLAAIGKEPFKSCKINDAVTIKGRFIGYDELLEEFKVDACTLIE